MNVHVVTRVFHHAGMDDTDARVLGVFSIREKADEFVTDQDARYASIAYPCEIEEFEIDVVDEDDD